MQANKIKTKEQNTDFVDTSMASNGPPSSGNDNGGSGTTPLPTPSVNIPVKDDGTPNWDEARHAPEALLLFVSFVLLLIGGGQARVFRDGNDGLIFFCPSFPGWWYLDPSPPPPGFELVFCQASQFIHTPPHPLA